jgi:hypothetical protein
MEIKDKEGKYLLKVDLKRNIVYEIPVGYWKPEDVIRLHNDYATKVVPLFKGNKWAKLCDLTNYTVSMITEEIQDHVKWGHQNGYTTAAVVVDECDNCRSVIELQMKIGSKNVPFTLKFFSNVEEADEWLKAQGF